MNEQFFGTSNLFGYILHKNNEGVIYTNDFDVKIFMKTVDDKTYEIAGCVIKESDNQLPGSIEVFIGGKYNVSSTVMTGILMDISGTININNINYILTGSRLFLGNSYTDVFLPPEKVKSLSGNPRPSVAGASIRKYNK